MFRCFQDEEGCTLAQEQAELVRIANGIKIYPTAAFPWLGR